MFQFLGESLLPKDIGEVIKIDDEHLRFFDACPLYTNTVLNNATIEQEYILFLKGQQMKGVLKDIQMKWGLQDVLLDRSMGHLLICSLGSTNCY